MDAPTQAVAVTEAEPLVPREVRFEILQRGRHRRAWELGPTREMLLAASWLGITTESTMP